MQTIGRLNFTIDSAVPFDERRAAFYRATGMQVINLEKNPHSVLGCESGEFEGMLVEIPSAFSEEEARDFIAALDSKHPWTPAKFDHLLAYATKYGGELSKHLDALVGIGTPKAVSVFLIQANALGVLNRFESLRACKIGTKVRHLAVRRR